MREETHEGTVMPSLADNSSASFKESDSMLIKHFGRMYVWGAEAWYEKYGGPERHKHHGRELIAQGEFLTLRNIADLYNNQLMKENENA